MKVSTSLGCSLGSVASEATFAGQPIPSNVYPLVDGNVEKCSDWVVELPIMDGKSASVVLEDGKSGARSGFDVVFEAAKWESRLNYRLRKGLCSEIRDIERSFLLGQYQPRILRFLEGDDSIVWRMEVAWCGSPDSMPDFRAIDGSGSSLDVQTRFFEFQPSSNQPAVPNRLFLSVELPKSQRFFSLVVSDPQGVIKVGFCSVNPGAYEAFKYESWKYMKDARADDELYRRWLAASRVKSGELVLQRQTEFAYAPLISVVVPCYNSDEGFLADMVASVRKQSYGNWELLLLDASSAESDVVRRLHEKVADQRVRYIDLGGNAGIVGNTNAGVKEARGDFVAFLDHDDLLESDALYEYVSAINRHPNVKLLFCDEDTFEVTGRYGQPVFKTQLNLDLLYSHNCVTHFLAINREFLLDIGLSTERVSGAQDYDLVLRAYEHGGEVRHVPRVLYHWRIHEGSTNGDNAASKPYAEEAGRIALQEHFDRRGVKGAVELTEHPFVYRMRYELPDPRPLVSIVIPSKDHVDMLDGCIRSIVGKSEYPRYEVIVVENNSEDAATFEYYERIQEEVQNLKVVFWPGEFNYSAIINFGASHAAGEYLLLLNNDTEVISGDFIEEMLGYLQRPEVGVVGAKLYFRDGLTQHAGMLIGPHGAVAHVNQDFPKAREGYLGKAVRPGNFSAVTGACQMVGKELFDRVGGYTEELAVGFNDVDFCLKVGQLGYRIVFTPYAELYHYEFTSRGREVADQDKMRRWKKEQALFTSKWPDCFLIGDPYTNPNLDPDSAYYALPGC